MLADTRAFIQRLRGMGRERTFYNEGTSYGKALKQGGSGPTSRN